MKTTGSGLVKLGLIEVPATWVLGDHLVLKCDTSRLSSHELREFDQLLSSKPFTVKLPDRPQTIGVSVGYVRGVGQVTLHISERPEL